MKQIHPRRGFTLIELLVVVLIIGILTAVALPQYKLAVAKSRVSIMLPLIKSLILADDAYYLANGVYTINVNLLDISLPEECVDQNAGGGVGQVWKCGTDFFIDNSGGNAPAAIYCPGNYTWTSCGANRHVRIGINRQNGISCSFYTNFGAKLCKSLNPYKLTDLIPTE